VIHQFTGKYDKSQATIENGRLSDQDWIGINLIEKNRNWREIYANCRSMTSL